MEVKVVNGRFTTSGDARSILDYASHIGASRRQTCVLLFRESPEGEEGADTRLGFALDGQRDPAEAIRRAGLEGACITEEEVVAFPLDDDDLFAAMEVGRRLGVNPDLSGGELALLAPF